MSEDIRAELRQLMMLISDIRSKDGERYEEHIKFSNEVVAFIKSIQENMNTNWGKIQKSLEDLNKSIETSLDSLLTGINPEGLKETSKSLKEIIDTMGKSIQSMNLENVLQELRGVSGGQIQISTSASKASAPGPASQAISGSKAGKSIQAGSQPYASAAASPAAGAAPAGSSANRAQYADILAELGTEAEYTDDELQMIKAAKEVYGSIPPHLKKKVPKKKKEDTKLLKPSDFFGS